MNEEMHDYEQSIQAFNDMCDNIMSDRRYPDTAINRIYETIERLVTNTHTLKESNREYTKL